MSRTFSRFAAVVCALVPLAFGALRAATTGTDFRYLIVAVVSLLAVSAVFLVTPPGTAAIAAWRRGVVALAAGTVVGSATAFGLGASSGPAVAIVSFCFTACFVAAGALGLFSRRPQGRPRV